MDNLHDIIESAEAILAEKPDPVVRFLLLKNVLRRPLNDTELVEAREDLSKNRWVQLLEREQWEDGIWGRLHTKDTRLKQKIPTTEYGVVKAVSLGLDANHPVLAKAFRYLASIIETGGCRDRQEKNPNWPIGMRLIIASTMSMIQPESPLIDDVWSLWAEIARRTFESGRYDCEAEKTAYRELTGVKGEPRYLTYSVYNVSLLGSRAKRLDKGTEEAYVEWIWKRKGFISYVEAPLDMPLDRLPIKRLDQWVYSMELLSAFPSWRKLAAEAIGWLWQKRNDQELWDFPTSGMVHRLSGSWRKPHRQHDWSTRILILLRRFHDMSPQTATK